MRLRTFNAATMTEAMRLVREQLGDNAVIIATEPTEGGCMITAAVEDEQDEFPAEAAAAPDPLETIAAALDAHGVPLALAQRLGSAALDGIEEDCLTALAGALAASFRFAPIAFRGAERLLLVGPPGVGKTVTAAKLAARQVLTRRPLRLISTDMERAGGFEQLAALARVLATRLAGADGPQALAREAASAAGPVVIDSPGFNPYRPAERREIRALAEAARAEPVLVLAAGMDLAETADISNCCRELGCRRLIVTRLDLSRRLGNLLVAAEAGDYAFAEVGVAPDIADGLCPLTPLGLARLLLPEPLSGADAAMPDPFDRGARP
ncbi:MAG: AAA family ATPase [Alphaproteobacteria bacterium]|nr:AAA family ATPase [Alphaproteobacteria bacterium]